VAGIVKLDDLGLRWQQTPRLRPLGNAILVSAPWLMRGLSVLGTAAMFLVGGGIIRHGIPSLGEWAHDAFHDFLWFESIAATAFDGLVGLAVGGALCALGLVIGKIKKT
jgi:hypothetical protein